MPGGIWRLPWSIQLWDKATGYVVKPRSDGTLDVNANVGGIPPIPEGATQVITNTGLSDVSSTAGVDTFYTITNAKVLTIQSLAGGAEAVTSGSVVELYYDPSGTGTPLTLIGAPLWVDGESNQVSIGQEFTGDGTRRIVLRRRGYSGSAREMAASWFGYEL